MEKEKFGARALVFIKHDYEIEELAKVLNSKMEIQIYFDTYEDPPHEFFGMCEFLGFELWLNRSNTVTDYNFEILVETSFFDAKDVFDYEMFDLSPWLSEEISRRCELETYY